MSKFASRGGGGLLDPVVRQIHERPLRHKPVAAAPEALRRGLLKQPSVIAELCSQVPNSSIPGKVGTRAVRKNCEGVITSQNKMEAVRMTRDHRENVLLTRKEISQRKGACRRILLMTNKGLSNTMQPPTRPYASINHPDFITFHLGGSGRRMVSLVSEQDPS